MNAANLFGINNSWMQGVRAQGTPAADRAITADGPITSARLRASVTQAPAPAPTPRDNLRSVALSLRDAVAGFARETKPVYTTYYDPLERVTAQTAGRSARVDPTQVSYWEFAATEAVNTQQATTRVSTERLGLDVTSPSRASTLVSTAEMNTSTQTSYDAHTLAFKNGGSAASSKGTLTGTYTGTGKAADATALIVEVTSRGNVGNASGKGASPVSFEVRDQTGETLFTYSGTLKAGQGVYLGADIGLTLSFTAGELKKNHEASTTVRRNQLSADPNAAFNGAAASRPQFDNGAVVKAGSFTVNGTTIAVKNNDTINSVLLRLATSGAGVIGFVNDDRVTLASIGSSEAPIVVGNDTSGFLAATKLANAVSTQGNVRDDNAPLSRSSQFSTVIDGSFSVNGVAIAVNRNADSLTSILARVNNSAAGVTATYDAEADAVRFTPKVAGGPLALDQDTSGFLGAIRMPTGVSTTVVDPDRTFNGTGLDAPGFDVGHTVRGGSFVINGTTITVAADDTLNAVLNRITASAAGVTAKFDKQSGKVSLVAKDYGEAIAVGNDTSGFLAAVKLDATAEDRATTVSRSAFGTRLEALKEFDAVTRGTLTVNGEQIVIDPYAMTMADVVASVDAVRGVRASLNRDNGIVDIWSDDGSKLTFTDTSGLLDAIGIRARAFDNFREGPDRVVQTGTVTVSNAVEVADDVTSVLIELNDVLTGLLAKQDRSFRAGLKAALETPLDLLRDAGVRGLEIVDDGENVGVAVEIDRLIEALDATHDEVDLGRELADFVDAIDGAVAAAAGWEEGATRVAQVIRLEDTSLAQPAADQAQAMAGKPAVKAYRR